eukprot:TRINITY_DN17777_c0_g1_i1.p1 TRINITY_DN17777_c0_g1~~TRINITY_DN17777_c0_g1_i1.p1  ORF type:complete len:300 (-),score=53.49 TRINITY_DN17777_c0_g1_i1:1435-2334(-)
MDLEFVDPCSFASNNKSKSAAGETERVAAEGSGWWASVSQLWQSSEAPQLVMVTDIAVFPFSTDVAMVPASTDISAVSANFSVSVVTGTEAQTQETMNSDIVPEIPAEIPEVLPLKQSEAVESGGFVDGVYSWLASSAFWQSPGSGQSILNDDPDFPFLMKNNQVVGAWEMVEGFSSQNSNLNIGSQASTVSTNSSTASEPNRDYAHYSSAISAINSAGKPVSTGAVVLPVMKLFTLAQIMEEGDDVEKTQQTAQKAAMLESKKFTAIGKSFARIVEENEEEEGKGEIDLVRMAAAYCS